jgi:aminoglycoside-2''-adenylyltransferase
LCRWCVGQQVRIPVSNETEGADLFRAAKIMHGFRGRWGIAGGWAIDLFVGRRLRPHADIDVAILRDDQSRLRDRLSNARIEKVVDGELVPWGLGERLELPVHEIHVTWPDGFHAEFLLNEYARQSQEWLFRRDPRVRRPADSVFSMGRGLPRLSPEVVLLYKSKGTGAKDDADFAAAIGLMTPEQRSWLRGALTATSPEHHWLATLAT